MNDTNNNGSSKVRNASVRYEKKFTGQFSGEVLVTINTSKGLLTAIFPSSSIDEAHKTIIAVVISEREDSYLVDLPTYTFTSGSKVWFSKDLVALKVA